MKEQITYKGGKDMERLEQIINEQRVEIEKKDELDELLFHLGQNTYIMSSFYNARDRRAYEDFKIRRIAQLLKIFGFEVSIEDGVWNLGLKGKMVRGRKQDLYIEYWIRCTCRNVYKKKIILYNGEKKDIRFLRKFLQGAKL